MDFLEWDEVQCSYENVLKICEKDEMVHVDFGDCDHWIYRKDCRFNVKERKIIIKEKVYNELGL